MKNLTLFTMLLLIGTAFTSCLTDVSLTETEEEEVRIPDEEVANSTTFSFGSRSLRANFAFLRTTPNAAGDGFDHVLVLTEEEVTREDGDLTGYVNDGAIGIIFSSTTNSPEGIFPVIVGTEATEGVKAAGGYNFFNFSSFTTELADRSLASGTLSIVKEGDDYQIAVDLTAEDGPFTITGQYKGEVSNVVLPDDEPVQVAEFSGENLLKRDEESFALSNAYLVEEESISSGKTYYRLFLTEERVDTETGELSGVTNAVLLRVFAGDRLTTGRHTLKSFFADETTGFFARSEKDFVRSSFLCRDMNFDTDTMLDDEPMDIGETTILVEGNDFKIKFNYQSIRGAKVSGEFQGDILTLRR